ISIPEYKEKTYHIVLSIDVGNTTTDCIITGTNLESGITYLINRNVTLMNQVKIPKTIPNEEKFGQTLDGIILSKEAVENLVKDIITKTVSACNLDLQKELDYAVHSTGIVAEWESPDHINNYLGSITKGCLDAGISMSKMRPVMTKNSLPEDDRRYSLLDKVRYDGSIAGVIPATGISGEDLIANDMEGDLSLAGIKQGAKNTQVDFRNPCLSLDMGTILDGRITEYVPKDRKNPYARTIGCFIGLGGAIADTLVKGTGKVDKQYGNAQEFLGDEITTGFFSKKESVISKKYSEQIHNLIQVEIVPHHRKKYGQVPIDPQIAENEKISIIGVDCGDDFSNYHNLQEIGGELFESHGLKIFTEVVDRVCAQLALRMIDLAHKEGLIHQNSAIGFSGRAIMSGRKPEYVLEGIMETKLFPDPYERVIFVSSALPRGAAVMARCVGCLGNPKQPLGGCRGEGCILGRRKAFQAM
ncbi:MAG: methanogenesis marker 14 protein, partial [Methanospirillum sp.]|uniref:methanogenesis marker 14 protein n=1 Tax=Methanospirillum sp. TaxID=45200 RepID=UPI00236BD198